MYERIMDLRRLESVAKAIYAPTEFLELAEKLVECLCRLIV